MTEHMPRILDPDSFYEVLLEAHAGLTLEQSARLNAALVLLLAESWLARRGRRARTTD